MDKKLTLQHFELYCCQGGIDAYWKRLPEDVRKKAKKGLTFPELISWATHTERYWIHLAARKTYPEEYMEFYSTHPMLDLWECGTMEDLILDVEKENTLLNVTNMTLRQCEFHCEGKAVFTARAVYATDSLFSGNFELKSEGGSFTDCGFEGRIAYPAACDACFKDCVFNQELLLGVFERTSFGTCTFADIEIKNTDFRGVNFDIDTFKNVKFVDCVFKDCTFRSCTFDRVTVETCMHNGCKFELCKDIFARDKAGVV